MRSILYVVILAIIATPLWQIGSIKIEKKEVAVILERHANSLNSYDISGRVNLVEKYLRKELKKEGFTLEPTIMVLEERRRIRIEYPFNRTASVFGHPYYQTDEIITAETFQ